MLVASTNNALIYSIHCIVMKRITLEELEKKKKKELHSSSQFNSSIGCAIRYNCFGINMNWNGIHFVNKLQIFLEGGTM